MNRFQHISRSHCFLGTKNAVSAGPVKFADAQWAQDFARAASAALGRPMVHIDVTAMSINY